MKFGPVPVADATGGILAHSLRLDGRRIGKGAPITADLARRLTAAGVTDVMAAFLEPGDLDENAAADRVARLFVREGLIVRPAALGRANLMAEADGMVTVDAAALLAVNRQDEAITLATVPNGAGVKAGELVATVKIITFGVPAATVDALESAGGAPRPLALHPYRPLRAALVQSAGNGMRETLYQKSIDVAGLHLAVIGASLTDTAHCEHSRASIAGALTALAGKVDLILVLGASSPVDRRDVMPQGLIQAGGEIVHLGMPVDPGNLTLVGRLGDAWVFGLPGSARSPRAHGFDLLLRRVAAGLDISSDDILRMALGGVLKEPLHRPSRAIDPEAPKRIGAVVLAAGRSSRMGDRNKLLEDIDGQPLAARTLATLGASQVSEIVVVTGHDAEAIAAIADEAGVPSVYNDDYADGLSTSIRAGLAALGPDLDGVLICLADMPDLTAPAVDRLIDAFNPAERAGIVVPVARGQRGNPVLFDTVYREEIGAVTGDMGAREVIRLHPDDVAEVELDDAVLTDLDTPEAWTAWRQARTGR